MSKYWLLIESVLTSLLDFLKVFEILPTAFFIALDQLRLQ
jgi:hypothetical protein